MKSINLIVKQAIFTTRKAATTCNYSFQFQFNKTLKLMQASQFAVSWHNSTFGVGKLARRDDLMPIESFPSARASK